MIPVDSARPSRPPACRARAGLADLLHDRRGGDVERRLARAHEAAAQAREQLLEPDRVALQLERVDPAVAPRLGELPLGLEQHLARGAPLPADRRRLLRQRLELPRPVDDRHLSSSRSPGLQVEDPVAVQSRGAARRDRERVGRRFDDRRPLGRVPGPHIALLEDRRLGPASVPHIFAPARRPRNRLPRPAAPASRRRRAGDDHVRHQVSELGGAPRARTASRTRPRTPRSDRPHAPPRSAPRAARGSRGR